MSASCSWCWKTPSEVAVLIQGFGGAYICDECIELCVELIEDKKAKSKTERRREPWACGLAGKTTPD
jgi:ATP-dependent protease Clp ATPase subunit